MIHVVRINVVSRDDAQVADAVAFRALVRSRACAGDVELGEAAVGIAQVAMGHAVGVKVRARDRSFQVEGGSHRSEGVHRARRIE